MNPTPNSPAMPSLIGQLGALNVNITAGNVTKTLIGTNVSGYDLFANGFAKELLAGSTISITFNVPDSVTEQTIATNFSGWGGASRVPFVQPSLLHLDDTRIIIGGNSVNFLTLYTTPPAQLGLATPEPVSGILVGVGLAALVYVRRRSRQRR
jgi:hypothetical protein